MPNISFATAAVTKVPINVTGRPVFVSLQANIILPNVMVYVELRSNNGTLFAWAHLSGNQTGVGQSFTESGYVQFVTLLVPQYNRVVSNTPLDIEYIVGLGDGTGTDFKGANAATMAFTLNPALATNNILAYTNPLTAFDEDTMLNQGFTVKASIKDPAFYNAAASNKSVNLAIEADADGKSMLEDKVWLHLYDVGNNLLGIVDIVRDGANNPTVVNNNVNFNYGGDSGDFQVFAVIVPKPDPADPNSTIFEIGDPKTNAKVTVSQS